MNVFAPFERWIDPFRSRPAEPPPASLGSFLFWSLRDARWAIVVLAVASFVVGAGEAAIFAYAGGLVDMAAASGREDFWQDNALSLALLAALVLLIRPVGMALTTIMTSVVIGPSVFPMTVWRLHRHTLGQSLRFFDDDFAGRLSQKQIQTSQAVTQVTIEVLNALGFLFAYVVAATVIMAGINPMLALVVAIWAVAWLALLSFSLPRIRKASKARAEARAGVTGQLVDSLTNMITVKLFAHAAREENAALGALSRFREKAMLFGRENAGFRIGLIALNASVMGITIIAAIMLWQSGDAGIGILAAATAIVFRATGITGWVSMAALNIFSEIGTMEDGIQTLSPRHDITDASDAKTPHNVQGAVGFDNVSFRYGRDIGGVGPLDLHIPAGQKIGLVGRSGAGKSTLTSLLLRLYETEEGRVLLDGMDIRDLTQDGLRQQISVVTQETAIFNRSAMDNILYGRPEASEEQVLEAAHRARADDFIASLEDFKGRQGYNAFLGERGVKLSGGQRQRIALARAILKDAPILVLDEATSSLDSEVEAAIQQELQRLMQGKTVIAIAHRLSTIRAMDRIVVLDQGRIVEDGNHDALVDNGGLYASLWSRQSHGFIGLEAAEQATTPVH